jgi:hypothetical protein
VLLPVLLPAEVVEPLPVEPVEPPLLLDAPEVLEAEDADAAAVPVEEEAGGLVRHPPNASTAATIADAFEGSFMKGVPVVRSTSLPSIDSASWVPPRRPDESTATFAGRGHRRR